MRYDFVKESLVRLRRHGDLNRQDRVLAVCAGTAEHPLFRELEFEHGTISNLDERMDSRSFRPYAWSRQDAQNLTFEDGVFDVVFVADGLHHCASPHRPLLEMYRVARKGRTGGVQGAGRLRRRSGRYGGRIVPLVNLLAAFYAGRLRT